MTNEDFKTLKRTRIALDFENDQFWPISIKFELKTREN